MRNRPTTSSAAVTLNLDPKPMGLVAERSETDGVMRPRTRLLA